MHNLLEEIFAALETAMTGVEPKSVYIDAEPVAATETIHIGGQPVYCSETFYIH